jgi:membrane-associated phospholipid phosphatase
MQDQEQGDYIPGGEKQTVTHSAAVNRSLVWLVVILSGLIVFIRWLPGPVREFFWRGLQEHSLAAGLLLVFLLLSMSLVWSAGQRLDAWAFLQFNLRGPRPAWLDWVMLGFTQLGSGVAGLGLALAFYLSGRRLLAYELVLGTLTLWLVVELFKALLRRRRPAVRLGQARIAGWIERGRSFPSGHTSQVFFLATLLAHSLSTGLLPALFLYGLAVLVGLTRIYVGAHYPRDVLAGAMLGSAWGLLGGLLYGGLL